MIKQLLLRVDDPERDGLRETPERFLRAFEFWTSGYHQNPEDVFKTFDGNGYDEMVTQLSIPYFSLCEHHLCPFFGMCHIGYIPNGPIVGLSKLARLLEVFARRLQVQEKLCSQVANALMEHLQPRGAGVVMQGRHLCLESRGVQKIGTITVTSALRGVFKDDAMVRAEFMSLVTAGIQGVLRP
jgi:GTP cyclohydrolase I